jgi:citronellol/citronellal dehydrogenase
VEAAGGQALAVVVDVRDESSVQAAVDAAAERFGSIDICVNNASAISLTGTLEIEMKRYDLMHQVNARGTFLVSRACIPHLRKAENPHVLSISPPLDFRPEWFSRHAAYSAAKFGMSVYMMAMAAEFRADGIAFNGLWPRTTIATSAIKFGRGGDTGVGRSRRPEVMADAAYAIFSRPARAFTGQFVIDDDVLWAEGESDFSRYAVDPAKPLAVDLYVDPAAATPPGVRFG